MTTFSVTIPTLRTERLTLRAQSEADVPAMEAFFSSDRSRFVGGPVEPSQVWGKMAGALGHWALRGYGIWAIEVEGQTAGWTGVICPPDWPEPELGWGVYEGFEGKGLAYEAALTARRYAAKEWGLTPIISLIDPANTRSAKLAERLGAVPESDTIIRGAPCRIWRHPVEVSA